MDPVVPCALVIRSVHAAACHNDHIRIFLYVKIIIDHVIHTALCYAGRNVDRIFLFPRRYIDVDPRVVGLWYDPDRFGGTHVCTGSVLSDGIGAVKQPLPIRDLLQHVQGSFIDVILSHLQPPFREDSRIPCR